ncbi:phosphatidylethanolamine-binding protein [Chaetomidium leptoderma]|uniref:Phosphatidylethanolamine-binding protein n=1 Tax=Chaetomidium leptoderma TaxID=669021 RepID=A0AAN6ZVP9_9PEZI|nr:phosphatidylethanolamine-binding protein [Chaetomidium leptoderma]
MARILFLLGWLIVLGHAKEQPQQLIDDFSPSLGLHVTWPSKERALLGNTLNPKDLHHEPSIALHDMQASSPELFTSDVTYVVMSYKPPGPPEKTGEHRYVFLAFVPSNGTTDKLHLSKPSDRKHWGYDTEKNKTKGVREWAEENGLAPVGANFIYAKHKKQ